MNFDTIVMNPPYLSKQMVYLKFLKKAQDCGHHVLGLHPAIPFLDQRKKNRWTNLLNTFSKNLNYLRVIHSKKYFPDVDIQSILCITYFSANIKPLDYCCDLTGINLVIPMGNPDLYSGHLGYDKLFDRFNSLKKEDTILDWEIPRKHYKTEGWVVELSLVRGNIYKDNNPKFFKPDIFSYNPRNTKPKKAIDTQSSNKNKFWFQTYDEAQYFCDYIDTDFARGILGTIKRDYNPKFKNTPKINLQKNISSAYLYKRFGLTQPEIEFIEWLLTK